MKKNVLKLTALFLVIFTGQTFAQRFLTEVFPSATVTPNIVYGNNFEFITGGPVAIDLKCDMYEPGGAVDPMLQRPLIIFMHTGSFLPAVINGQPTGTRNDSATVEICKRFAKRGYVVANMEYRQGWNPIGSSIDIRRGTLLQAVYRAVQDAKACVRYFHKDASLTNPFKIDPNNIILGGQGSGGYVAINYACLYDPAQINLPKFISNVTDATYGFFQGQSYVIMAIWGDYDGFGGTAGFNNPTNSVGFSNEVKFVFNLGGALGDSTWLEAGNAPMVAFHVVSDPFAPYGNGIVYVPTNPPQPVVDVSGSGVIIPMANALGNNDCFKNAGFTDPFTLAANTANGGADGLFPFNMTQVPQAAPWEWFDSLSTVAYAQAIGLTAAEGTTAYQNGLATNPDMNRTKAMHYIDTIMGYLNPRVVYCLNLPLGVSENETLSQSVDVYPNPASADIFIKSAIDGEQIRNVDIADITGKSVRKIENINALYYRVKRENISPGVYFVKVGFDKGTVLRKIMLK